MARHNDTSESATHASRVAPGPVYLFPGLRIRVIEDDGEFVRVIKTYDTVGSTVHKPDIYPAMFWRYLVGRSYGSITIPTQE